ncbi:type I-F CRISPR-associated protein Csy3 [Massilia sp. W12]|uniref:type I-F CRISPR-associated protein Csy3 n=1 Tax=Massilia sp. W12 TaxID=3126507 RepID=UPI0030CAB6D2
MAKSTNATLKTASVLAFERKLANSDGLMFAGNWAERNDADKWRAVELREKSVRGTISNRPKSAKAKQKTETHAEDVATNPAKLDAEIQNANLQTIDVAALPFDADTLKVSFSLRVLGNLALPSACNDQAYQAALAKVINDYIATHRFEELALRYAHNIANARFLWRNRVGAEALQVRVRHIVEEKVAQTWTFDAAAFDLRSFAKADADLAALAEVIRQGLAGEAYAFLQIEAYARLGVGQEVFPSQELVLDKSEGKKSKFLYEVDKTAALHSQKIGNALRTIDDWYPSAAELGPIAVEPYGSVTNRGVAYRQPGEKMDFYNLLDQWVLKNSAPDVKQQHYVIATLVRGGVFGEAN